MALFSSAIEACPPSAAGERKLTFRPTASVVESLDNRRLPSSDRRRCSSPKDTLQSTYVASFTALAKATYDSGRPIVNTPRSSTFAKGQRLTHAIERRRAVATATSRAASRVVEKVKVASTSVSASRRGDGEDDVAAPFEDGIRDGEGENVLMEVREGEEGAEGERDEEGGGEEERVEEGVSDCELLGVLVSELEPEPDCDAVPVWDEEAVADCDAEAVAVWDDGGVPV